MFDGIKLSLFLLRLSVGWMFLWAGATKVLDPSWSAAGYLLGAKSFVPFYAWFAAPSVLPFTNVLNAWGLALVGLALVLGIAVRFASLSGIALMLLYYFALPFPYPSPYFFVVDDHLIYAAALLVLAAARAGRFYGLEKWCVSLPICTRYPRLRALFG
ncbi:DoxX family membrane protein [Candidatus Parcubacteria bacterium]|nr:DoxX family membrane protein [Candidatus Parcubacteria bacterium]